MKKIILHSAALIFICSTLSHAAPLNLSTTDWPPFTGTPDKPRVVIDLVQEALHRAGYDSSVSVVENGRLTPDIKNGKFDGSPALWRDKDRETFIEYSNAFLENRLILVGNKGADVSAQSFDQLKGKKIGTVIGYSYGDAVEKSSDVVFIPGPSQQANLEKLFSGQLDFILVDDLLVKNLMSHQSADVKSHLSIGRTPLITRALYLGLRKDFPQAKEIIQKFNGQLRGLLADGTYNKILQMDWIRADVDGDGKLELVSASNKIGKSPPSNSYSITSSTEQSGPDKYYVGGQMYSNWNQIPRQYKADELTRREKSKPLMALKF